VFTGIVEATGIVRAMEAAPSPTDGRLVVEATLADDDLRTGDSVAVSGCCLTVVERGPSWWGFDVSAETLARTTLGALAPGDRVNLERPVRLSDRLGGHLVQGHVDAVGVVRAPAPELAVELPPDLARYVVEKGSIAVDGCSLTVVEVSTDTFRVAVIPHTAAVTTLGTASGGDRVNLEVDVIAKYVARLLEPVATTTTDRGAHGER
jgi:riboflavin synthase